MTALKSPDNAGIRLGTANSDNFLNTPVEDRFFSLTRMAKRLFQVPFALVTLVDANRQNFNAYPSVEVREVPRLASFCDHVMLGDEIFYVPEASKDPRFANDPRVKNKPYIQFYAGCPLRSADGSKIGTLCIIDQKPRSLSAEDMDSLRDLALMIERELAAVQMAIHDELTDITNRRGFVMLAQNSLNFCARQNIFASLVFMDLDKFKAINDNFGHSEGDRALATFADTIKHQCRDSDLFARLGGDEFVMLLTGSSKEQSERAVCRFQEALGKRNREEKRGYNLSFSHGIVQFDSSRHKTVGELLAQSDALMYRCKQRCTLQAAMHGAKHAANPPEIAPAEEGALARSLGNPHQCPDKLVHV